MKRRNLLLLLSAALAWTFPAFAQEDLKSQYDKLRDEYNRVVQDRDNILSQSKSLLDMKSRFAVLENRIKSLEQENAGLKNNLRILGDEKVKIQRSVQEEIAVLKQGYEAAKKESEQYAKDRDEAYNYLEKLKIEYKMIPEKKKEISELQRQKEQMRKDFQSKELKLKRLEETSLDKEAQLEVYRRQIESLKTSYEEALIKNRALEKKVEELPLKFAEISRQNKLLVKETALMHYNLGVFYTKNQEYERAVAEFEKTIELNQNDPYAHYNLGYIYAEYMVNKPKAIDHFKKFLTLVKVDDKDVDWVKKYILTWETFDGKNEVK